MIAEVTNPEDSMWFVVCLVNTPSSFVIDGQRYGTSEQMSRFPEVGRKSRVLV